MSGPSPAAKKRKKKKKPRCSCGSPETRSSTPWRAHNFRKEGAGAGQSAQVRGPRPAGPGPLAAARKRRPPLGVRRSRRAGPPWHKSLF